MALPPFCLVINYRIPVLPCQPLASCPGLILRGLRRQMMLASCISHTALESLLQKSDPRRFPLPEADGVGDVLGV